MSIPSEYEFTKEQNHVIGDLASKMRYVGFFSVLFGLFALILTLILVGYMNLDRLPSDVRKKLNEAYEQGLTAEQKEVAKKAISEIPQGNSFLTGIAIFTGVTGLFFLLQGAWSRSAGAAFQQIVATEGNDIKNLMNAVNSLQWMYGMISKLLTLALLAALIAIGLSIYKYFYPA